MKSSTLSTQCPLCFNPEAGEFELYLNPSIGLCQYYQCSTCRLTFLEAKHHPTKDAAKQRYDCHQNLASDPGYVEFLSRLANPLSNYLSKGMKGLDFGCGPTQVMGEILSRKGYDIESFDPIYFPDSKIIEKQYDFILLSEVAEHLTDPRKDFELLDRLLKQNGYIGVMTQWMDAKIKLSDWYYVKDPTHVCFYLPETLRWIGQWLHWECVEQKNNVTIFRKR